MSKKKNPLKAPPARPAFDREDTRFISITEMQKKDPSLIPKKEKRNKNWVLPFLALVAIGILIPLTKSTLLEKSTLSDARTEQETPSFLEEIHQFTPPKFNPNQSVIYEKTSSPTLEENLPYREPTSYIDHQLNDGDEDYYDEFGNNTDYYVE